MRGLIPGAAVAAAMVAAGPASAAPGQFLDPNQTLEDGWHTDPTSLTVTQALDDRVREPGIPATGSDFAFADRRVFERYELGFREPLGEDPTRWNGVLSVYVGQRAESRSDYALRVTRGGKRVIVGQRNGISIGSARRWIHVNFGPATTAELRTLTVASRMNEDSGGTSPLLKNYALYVGLTQAP